MPAAVELVCPSCNRRNDARALACVLCGEVLRHEQRAEDSAAIASSAAWRSLRDAIEPADAAAIARSIAPSERGARSVRIDERRYGAEPDEATGGGEPWGYLAIGIATAPLFALTPILRYMAWFLASLVHEMGHAGFAWLCGMPAAPAISLDGHAAAVHSDQQMLLVVMIGAALVFSIWRCVEGRLRWIALALTVVLYPAIALTNAKELLHLLAGHGAELAFAALCLRTTLDGGFTESKLERALYSTVGWMLVGKNAYLCWGLIHSAAKRTQYQENGSFGFTNDYIRVADDLVHCPLQFVALGMLVATVLVLPAAIVLWRISTAARDA